MLKTNFNKVRDFTYTAGQPINNCPTMPGASLSALRLNLISEELLELYQAVLAESEVKTKIEELFTEIRRLTQGITNPNLINIDSMETPDALGDLLYVVYGAGLTFGFDLDDYFKDIHDSNMSKFPPSQEEAEETIRLYATGNHPDKPNQFITGLVFRKVVPSDGIPRYPVVVEASGKILKYHKYIPVKEIRLKAGKIPRPVYLG